MSATVSSPYEQSQIAASAPPQPQPHEIIWTLTNAYVPATCLHLIAELGVADQIGEQPTRAEAVAERLSVDADALDRVLSLLAAHGVFARREHAYVHTPASRLLRSDHAMSARAFPRMNGLPIMRSAFSNLEHSLRTGRPAIETLEPRGFWAYLQNSRDEAQVFAQAMSAKAAGDIAAVLGAYDFSRFSTVADIGGGRGHLLQAVLDSAPRARGNHFDLPEVIDTLDISGDRLTLLAGDFFVDPVPTADAYVLMEILHDWGDEQCVAILNAIRRAAARDATVLVIESVLADRGVDAEGHNLDVIMLAVTGGRERTDSELGELLEQAQFRNCSVIETASRLRIVEATAA
jgi:hypothetical protein